MAEQLTPQTPDLEVWGSSPAHRVVSLDKKLYSTFSPLTQEYKWIAATYPIQEGVAIFLRMLQAKEARISSGCLGPWLVCTPLLHQKQRSHVCCQGLVDLAIRRVNSLLNLPNGF